MAPLFEQLEGFEWTDWIIDKIINKHHVEPNEVEECFFNHPYKLRRAEEGKYQLLGHADSGRYLAVVFAWSGRDARIITARDMDASERRYYTRK